MQLSQMEKIQNLCALGEDLTCAVVILTCFDVCISLPPPVSSQQVRWERCQKSLLELPGPRCQNKPGNGNMCQRCQVWRCQFVETEDFLYQIFVSNGWLFTKYPSLNISINLHEFDTQKPSILAASQLRGIGWRSVRNAEKINPILK